MDSLLRLYVGATRQNDGKTTVALGLLQAISELYPRMGYMKPVGQQVRLIGAHQIDKDASLMREVFHFGSQLYDMSPVAVPHGFTEEYILHGDSGELRRRIEEAYRRESQGKEFMIIEGTGHAGVGSVLDLSNATVARMLDAPVVIVTCAGIGRPIDEVTLNKALFDNNGIDVLGVIVNKVMPEKYEKIERLARLGFRRKGIEVFGVIPFFPLLSSPTLRQLQEDIKGELLSGEAGLDQVASRILVGAMPSHEVFDYLKGDVVLVTPGNREDLILAAVAGNAPGLEEEFRVKGMILTCGVWPNHTVLKILKQTATPVILVEDDTFATAQKITNLIIKIRAEDREKIETVKQMVKDYVDIHALVERLKRRRAGSAR